MNLVKKIHASLQYLNPLAGSGFKSHSIAVGSLLLLVGVFVGGGATLAVRALRYTPLLPPSIVEVAPQEVYGNIRKDPSKYLFLDVRTFGEYRKAHAEGATSVPINTLYDGKKNLPRNTDVTIYLICTSGRLAGVAYGYLEHFGFRNIERVEGGLEGWNIAGLPIITDYSKDPDALTDEGLDMPFMPSNAKKQ